MSHSAPYSANKARTGPTADELRARIPGWGADLDPANRPAFPRELPVPADTGAHWDFPDRQPDDPTRERSLEHRILTPVYGTGQPLHGLSGVIRRLAYARYSEGSSAHWLLLIAGDRVEAVGAHVRSLATVRPDNPITETGVLSEARHHPISSRLGQGRVDLKHTWIDPILIVGPWVLAIGAAASLVRLAARRAGG